MELTLVYSRGVQVFSVAWVELVTPHGSFVIQRSHAPMIVILVRRSSIFFVLKSGKHESIYINRGVAEVTREKVTVILTEDNGS